MNNVWDASNLFTAQSMALSLEPKETVEAIFFHTRAERDDDNLFEIAAKTHMDGLTLFIILNGSDGQGMDGIPQSGWPGKTVYIEKLANLGVPRSAILLSGIGKNTREENREYLKVAQGLGFNRVAILAQPHQMLRATLGLIKEMSVQAYHMQIYCLVPHATDWQKKVYGNQGKNFKPRLEHAADECERIIKYTESGDLATPQEFFAYFQKR